MFSIAHTVLSVMKKVVFFWGGDTNKITALKSDKIWEPDKLVPLVTKAGNKQSFNCNVY